MSRTFRLFFCSVLLAALEGCGGNVSSRAPGSATVVTYTFNGNNRPLVVATQIGTGAYSMATLTSNKLILSVPSGETRYSVAFLCPSPTFGPFSNAEYIDQASTLDGTDFTETCAQAPLQGGQAAVEVDASAIPGAEQIFVGSGGGCGACQTFSGEAFLAVGSYDVPITVYDNGGPYDPPLAARILRDQTIPGALNGGAPVVFGTADEPVPETIVYDKVPDGYSPVGRTVIYNTAGGASVELELNNSGPALTQYVAMPAASYQSGDFYDFLVQASDPANGGTVSVESYTSTAGAQTFTFPPSWAYGGPTAAALPTFNFSYAGFSGSSNTSYQADLFWDLGTWIPGVAADFDAIHMAASANYQNGLSAMTVPDLSSVQGFLTPPPSGTKVIWSAGVYQGSPLLTSPPSGTIQGVSTSGSYSEP